MLGGNAGRRIQLLIALVVMLLVAIQLSELNVFAIALVAAIAIWIVALLLHRSIEVVFDRQFRVAIIRQRDLLGVFSYHDQVFELSQLEAIPVTSRRRYVAFGAETFWSIHVKFAGHRAVSVGTIEGESNRAEEILSELSQFLTHPLSSESFEAGTAIATGPQGLLAELLDSEITVRIGQILCLVMILLSLYAAPGMAIYYLIALVLGTWFDWLARRGDRT